MRGVRVFVAALALGICAWSVQAGDAVELAKKYAAGDAEAEGKLRALGADAVPALREVKPEKDEQVVKVRNLLTDIAVNTSKMEPASAALIHELAREEGKGKRYSNAERLYRRGEQLFDTLKDDADSRKDKAKSREYGDKQKICDRMKDKAGHKAKGDTHTGVNLGFVRVGKDHDMSDDWE